MLSGSGVSSGSNAFKMSIPEVTQQFTQAAAKGDLKLSHTPIGQSYQVPGATPFFVGFDGTVFQVEKGKPIMNAGGNITLAALMGER